MIAREEAIKKHRKMWNWIAEYIEIEPIEDLSLDIFILKGIYLYQEEDNAYLYHNCYLCEYDVYQSNKDKKELCESCPLDWESEKHKIPPKVIDRSLNSNGVYCTKKNSLFEIFDSGVILTDGKPSKRLKHIIEVIGKDKVVNICLKIASLKERFYENIKTQEEENIIREDYKEEKICITVTTGK